MLVFGCTSEHIPNHDAEHMPADCPSGTDLSWLTSLESNIISDGQKGEIYSYIYQGKLVFQVADCIGCPDAMIVVYTCKGISICQFGGIGAIDTCPDFSSSTRDKKLVWNN